MIRTNLSIAAAILREEIKQMIPETDTGSLLTIPENQQPRVIKDRDGNKNYSGNLLATKCLQLSRAMGVDGKDWGFRVAHFPNNTKISNDRKEAYLVPLSKYFILIPGGLLSEGTFTYVTHDMIISEGGTFVLFVPE